MGELGREASLDHGRSIRVRGFFHRHCAHIEEIGDAGDNLVADYSAFGPGERGVRVAIRDTDGDGRCEVVAVGGSNSPPRMRVLNGLTDAVRRESPPLPDLYTAGLSVG